MAGNRGLQDRRHLGKAEPTRARRIDGRADSRVKGVKVDLNDQVSLGDQPCHALRPKATLCLDRNQARAPQSSAACTSAGPALPTPRMPT